MRWGTDMDIAQLAGIHHTYERIDGAGDTFQRRARILQSIWRAEQGYEPGTHRGRLQGIGPFFGLSFRDPEVPITNFRDAHGESPDYPQFRLALLERGVHIFPTEKGLWYLSAAHTEQDIARTLESVDDALKILRR